MNLEELRNKAKTNRIALALRKFEVPISDVVEDPVNVRKHGPRNIDAIKASLQRFGQLKPIVVRDADGVCYAGNGTLEAAKALGWETIAVVRVPLSQLDATAFAIADNRTAELAFWDDAALRETVSTLCDVDIDLAKHLGFNDLDLDRLLDADAAPPTSLNGRARLESIVKYQVVIDCEDETSQATVLDRLQAEGIECRALIL
jgi:ParB-like chromosome segregation protein Spo0J